MDRIAIIGCGGSGKLHLARNSPQPSISRRFTWMLYYEQGWNPLPKDNFAAVQRDLVTTPRWVIDGNYTSSLPIRLRAADTVIFRHLPARTCLWGIAQRRIRHGGGQHDAFGVYDRITLGFVCYILDYRRNMAPRVRAMLADHADGAEVVMLRSRRAARRYLAQARFRYGRRIGDPLRRQGVHGQLVVIPDEAVLSEQEEDAGGPRDLAAGSACKPRPAG